MKTVGKILKLVIWSVWYVYDWVSQINLAIANMCSVKAKGSTILFSDDDLGRHICVNLVSIVYTFNLCKCESDSWRYLQRMIMHQLQFICCQLCWHFCAIVVFKYLWLEFTSSIAFFVRILMSKKQVKSVSCIYLVISK